MKHSVEKIYRFKVVRIKLGSDCCPLATLQHLVSHLVLKLLQFTLCDGVSLCNNGNNVYLQ